MTELILTMVLLLSDGQLAEQPASVMECQLVEAEQQLEMFRDAVSIRQRKGLDGRKAAA